MMVIMRKEKANDEKRQEGEKETKQFRPRKGKHIIIHT